MNPFLKIHALVSTLLLCATAADAVPLTIELPQEIAVYAPGPGSEIANGQCLICHSAEYVSTQPPVSPRAYWQATVEKMQKKFGAPLPDEQVAPLVDYLVKTYGNERPVAGK
jgi:sulfite dehydrogenase